MSKGSIKEISSADESASTFSKDELDRLLDEKSVEGSATSSHDVSDDSSLESDSSLHSSENIISEKDVICHLCNKQFASKGSLASHKSRFHRESNKAGITPASKDEKHDSLNQQSDEGSSDKQSIGDSSLPSDSSLQSAKKGLAGKHNLKSHKNRFHRDKKLESSYMSGNDMDDSDENSDSSTEDSTTERGYTSMKRKERKDLATFNATFTKILDSMKQVLQSKNCNGKEDCFNLLNSYIMAKVISDEFGGTNEHAHGLDVDMMLSDNEICFVDALLSTKSLTEIAKLMNENTNIALSILEQHVLPKRRKRE